MKKRFLSLFLILCLTFLVCAGLAACGDDEPENNESNGQNENNENNGEEKKPKKLTAPTVTLSGNTAAWGADSKADKFEISLDGNLSYVENTVTSKLLTDGQTFKIRAVGDGTNYSTSDWSNSVTYTASTPTPNPTPTKLASPTVTISETGLASWGAVANANSYVYKINDGVETPIAATSVQLTDGQSIVVKAVGDGTNYTDSDYSAAVTYTASTPTPNPTPTKLATPTVTVSATGLASWGAVANASSYVYKINDGVETPIAATSVQLTDGQSIVVKAVGDGTNYIDGDYSFAKTYTVGAPVPSDAPAYLGIFASSSVPSASNGLPDAIIENIPSANMMSEREYRDFSTALTEHFENAQNHFGAQYPIESDFDIYSTPGSVIYVQIWLNNPEQYTILSLKLNGTKYQVGGNLFSFFVNEGGTHYNCLYAAVTLPENTYISTEYTVTDIEYIANTFINADGTDEFMNENDTVSIGLPYTSKRPEAVGYRQTETTVNSYSASFSIIDAEELIRLSGGWLGVAVWDYSNYEIVSNKAIELGENSFTVTGLVENSYYDAIIYLFADLNDGYGVKAHSLYYGWIQTPEVLTIEEIEQTVVMNESGTGYVGAINVNASLSSASAEFFKLEIVDENENVVYTSTDFDGYEIVTEGVLNEAGYTVKLYYRDNEYPEGKMAERYVYVGELSEPRFKNEGYYTFVDHAIYYFEISSDSDNYASTEKVTIRFYNEESARYVAEDVLYLIDNPGIIEQLEQRLNELYGYPDGAAEMREVYDKLSRLRDARSTWENCFDSNEDRAFWEAAASEGKYYYEYTYEGQDTDNVFFANGVYYVLLKNVMDNADDYGGYDISVTAYFDKNDGNGLTEYVRTENERFVMLFDEEGYYSEIIDLKDVSISGNELTFTMYNPSDPRIGDLDIEETNENKRFIYQIQINGVTIYENEQCASPVIDEDAWIAQYIADVNNGTLNEFELYTSFVPDYKIDDTITLDLSQIRAGIHTLQIQTRKYDKIYEGDEYDGWCEVYDVEIFKQLDAPELEMQGIYGYVKKSEISSDGYIVVEAYDKDGNPIKITDFTYDYEKEAYRFDFAYPGAEARVRLTAVDPSLSNEGGDGQETVYWYDSEWTNYKDSAAVALNAPTVSLEYNVLRWRADGNPEDYVQGYKFIISYEGYEREGDSIELYYLSRSCTIKVKTVPNYMGEEAGYCESEWTTYTYTRPSSGADGKG